ncbi:lysozyme inhibitor LprI family protein [Cytobacillus sp. FJAT-53684]|uniref:Lysozyme inhibitor LprI family protein n=1 Tax=Cytobacillus mangrovibacter TaxID=3299024 RepID=A0ABW6JVS9_9BACI
MKRNKGILIVMCTVVFVLLLVGCKNASEESSATLDNQSPKNSTSQNTKDDSSNVDSKEDPSNNNHSDTTNPDSMNQNEEDTSVPTSDKDSSTNTTASLKEEYLKKLNATKIELEKVEAEDSSTYALKKVENDRYDVWDKWLNEIYGALKEQLTTEEMDQLRKEQRNWITYRDDTAKEASLKFQGGTMEHLEYVAVLANLTEERCFELVEDYMK